MKIFSYPFFAEEILALPLVFMYPSKRERRKDMGRFRKVQFFFLAKMMDSTAAVYRGGKNTIGSDGASL